MATTPRPTIDEEAAAIEQELAAEATPDTGPAPARETHTPEAQAPAAMRVATTVMTRKAAPLVSTAGAVVPVLGGAMALATMSDSEFQERLTAMVKLQERMTKVKLSVLKEGIDADYGKIPGTAKDALLKGGMEKLYKLFNLVPCVTRRLEWGDGISAPQITVLADCEARLGGFDGPVIGTGTAAGNGWEIKWRYRNQQRACPECGQPTIINGKPEYNKGSENGGVGKPGSNSWLCFGKRGGCSRQWAANDDRPGFEQTGDPAIEKQAVGKEENPDAMDLLNTIIKVVNKRAKMDAILDATASSSMFTQDLDEGIPGQDDSGPAKKSAAAPASQQASKPAPSGNGTGGGTKPAPAGAANTKKAATQVAREKVVELATKLVIRDFGDMPTEELKPKVEQCIITSATFDPGTGPIVPRSVDQIFGSGTWTGRLIKTLEGYLNA